MRIVIWQKARLRQERLAIPDRAVLEMLITFARSGGGILFHHLTLSVAYRQTHFYNTEPTDFNEILGKYRRRPIG